MRIAGCNRCQRIVWVNIMTQGGAHMGEFCADCFEIVPHDNPGHADRMGSSSGLNHNDPGFDNVVRASEEDR